MIQTIPSSPTMATTTTTTAKMMSCSFTPSEVKVFGVHQVAATQQQQEQRKKRRRRRRNKSHHCHVSDDSSTSATVSSDSTFSSHHQQRLDLTASPPSNKAKKNITKIASRNSNNNDHVSLEEQAKYVALDCEMVGVGYGGRRSSVARVTLVAWDGSIILDEMVRQEEEVTDYRTFVSGITAQDLETASYSLYQIREMVQDILQDKVLVGHALKNDLRALGIAHPWYNTRDTAKYEQFMQVRFDDGVLWPKKLSELAKTRLHRDIQQPGVPHSSYEDAVAAMDLYKLVRRKWDLAMSYKINKTMEIENSKVVAAKQ